MWTITFMTSYWVLWLLRLAGFFFWSSLGILIVKMILKDESGPVRTRSSSSDPTIKIIVPRKKWVEITSILVVAFVSFWTGYLYRDHQEVQNTFTFHDVRIIKEANPHRWLLATNYIGEWWVTICPDYTPTTWQPGYTLKVLVYEDEGCKRLSGPKEGFVINRDEHGIPIKEEKYEPDN